MAGCGPRPSRGCRGGGGGGGVGGGGGGGAGDGPGRAPLWPAAGHGHRVAAAGGDRRQPHRRRPAQLLGRHAPAPANRPQSGHATATDLHGRADLGPGCIGAGAPAGPAAPAHAADATGRRHRHPWPGRGPRAGAPHVGDAARPRGRIGPDRPVARRPAAPLHPTPGLFGTATMNAPIVQLQGVAKRFTLHQQNGIELPVLARVNLCVHPGECLVLDGPSGMGKSSLLKMIYANYLANEGSITGRSAQGALVDVTQATPRALVQFRRDTVGYLSQFLRVIPRVSALDVVAEPLIEDAAGDARAQQAAYALARSWLSRLRIPERLWPLPPATFSGGEQQRINIARNMIKPKPLKM